MCKRTLEKDPKNILIYNDLDRVYLAMSNFEKSIETNKLILKNFKPNRRHWYNLANAYYKNGDFDKALESLDKALKINSDDHLSFLFREQILKRMKENK